MLLVHILYEGRHLLSARCPAASGTWQLAECLVRPLCMLGAVGSSSEGSDSLCAPGRLGPSQIEEGLCGRLPGPRPLETGPKGPLIMSPKLPA